MPTRAPNVFISYSSTDGAFARRLARKLDAVGIPHFLDRKRINLGDDFKARISEGLERCTDFVLIASPSSLDSPWVFFELGQAVAFRCRIVPLLLHPGLKLPSFLSQFHYASTAEEVAADLARRQLDAKKSVSVVLRNASPTSDAAPIRLSPTSEMSKYIARFPSSWFHSNVAIDGAMELHTFPNHANPYGGIVHEQLTTHVTHIEWSDLATAQLPQSKLDVLGTELRSWIGSRRAKPNRIRYLAEAPAQMVLDNNEFQMTIGNSDYFTMRTVTSLSKRSHTSTEGDLISQVFDSWWSGPKSRFPATTVPYHVSAMGVLFITDPDSAQRFLILTLPNAQRVPLVPGWNASFAEQMWAPSPTTPKPPWWKPYTSGLDIESPKDRTGDRDIWATVKRGMHEELGLLESDLSESPRLVVSCIEQDMYFVAFVFVLQATMSLAKLQKRRLTAPDKEIGLITAYPLDGVDSSGEKLDSAKQFASLLARDQFDGGPYLIPRPGQPAVDRWHLSSRLRIYAAARHLEGNRLLDYVSPT